MASFSPTRRLSSVDLPALGRPMKETKPDFTARRSLCFGGLRRRLELRDAHTRDAPPLRVEDFHAEAVELEVFADRRHTADAREQIPADGLEALAFDLDAQPLRP